jgi:hypothetical protein
MKALRNTRATYHAARRLELMIDRPVIVLGTLLLLLMVFAVGCSIAADLTTTTTDTTAPATGSTTSTLEPTTNSTTAQTTTTVSSTSTTLSQSTTTSVTAGVTAADAGGAAQQPAGTVLYEINDWSSGTNGWAAAGQWKTGRCGACRSYRSP